MKSIKSFIITGLSLSLLWALGWGCGGTPLLVITPSEATVTKGSTQQFLAETSSTVTWSVEGGAANGTIDSNGLYTPPSVLPLDPQVTIRAQDEEGAVGTAVVNLRTGDTLTFGSAQIINDTPITPVAFSGFEPIGAGVSNRLAARVGSLRVAAVWTVLANGNLVASRFDQNIDEMGFGPDLDLLLNSNTNYQSTSLVLNQDFNPATLVTRDDLGIARIYYVASFDQGNTFLSPVAIDPSDLSADQVQGNAQLDAGDQIHVVYSHQAGGSSKIRYTQSQDQGANWRPAIEVNASGGFQQYANLVVSADGQTLYLCYMDDQGAGFNAFVVKSTDGGQSFGSPVALTNSGGLGFCSLALGPQGQVYGVITEPQGDVAFTKSEDGGVTFSPPAKLSSVTPTPVQLVAFIAVDSLGRIDVVWGADSDMDQMSDSLLYVRSTDGGDIFSEEAVIAVGGVTALPLGLVHDISGRLHVIYSSDIDDINMSYNIYYQQAE